MARLPGYIKVASWGPWDEEEHSFTLTVSVRLWDPRLWIAVARAWLAGRLVRVD